MLSKEFLSIFDNAAGIIRLRNADTLKVDIVLKELRKRFAGSQHDDPILDRNLFFEPWEDAQIMGVPESIAEAVAVSLQNLTVLNVWTRVSCPNMAEEESAIIVETNSAEALCDAIQLSCPHCGVIHTEAELRFDIEFAPNPPATTGPRVFEVQRIETNGAFAHDQTATDSTLRIVEMLIGQLSDAPTLPSKDSKTISQALSTNAQCEQVPSIVALWKQTSGVVLLLSCTGIIGIVISAVLVKDTIVTVCISVLAFLIVAFYLWSSTQAFIAPTALQRRVSGGGILLSTILVASGCSGVCFKTDADSKLPIRVPGFDAELPLSFSYGQPDLTLILIGIVVYVLVIAFVLVHDGKVGWFS